MPFVSKAQAKWMYANKPEMAKEWSSKTPNIKRLPNHVKKKKSYGEIYSQAHLPTMPTSTYRRAITHPFNPLAGNSKYQDPKGARVFGKKRKVGVAKPFATSQPLIRRQPTPLRTSAPKPIVGDALRSGNYHQRAQGFINSAKSMGYRVRSENNGQLNAYKKHKSKVTKLKHKLGLKGQTKPGDMLKAYKKKT